MKGLNKFPEEYFLKYKTKPVKLKPYNPKQEEIAQIYLNEIKEVLKGYDVRLKVRGSTSFKILGKGEVEVGIYPKDEEWIGVIEILKEKFGEPENIEEDYVRFNDKYEEIEVEIILLKGHEANADIKLHDYMIANPRLLKEYEEVKKKYCFSKREYQRQKHYFLSRVIEKIPA